MVIVSFLCLCCSRLSPWAPPTPRQVQSSAFVPLLLLLAVCGVGLHVVGFASVSLGYFRWTVSCEGVVTVTDDSGRCSAQLFGRPCCQVPL